MVKLRDKDIERIAQRVAEKIGPVHVYVVPKILPHASDQELSTTIDMSDGGATPDCPACGETVKKESGCLVGPQPWHNDCLNRKWGSPGRSPSLRAKGQS